MTPNEFREHGHALIDWIATYRETIEERAVSRSIKPGSIRAALPKAPPRQAESVCDIMADFDSILLPGVMHWQHPSFFGFFPSNVELSSVLGDLLSTGLGMVGISWEASPALTELEETCVDWMRQMLGLGPAWRGAIQESASASTLIAIVCARERYYGRTYPLGGGRQPAEPGVVYTSARAHSSVNKTAMIAGFGVEHIRIVPTQPGGSLDTKILRAMIEEDIARGARPAAIVATTGATADTAMDDIDAVAEVAQEWGVWLHVDAAMGGAAMLLPEYRPGWEGIERADSIVVSPNKWLGAAFDSSLMFVRDHQHLIKVMGTNPSYLRTPTDGQVTQLRDWSIPTGRRFRALKLWFLIREQGVDGLSRRIRRDLANARRLAQLVEAEPEWRVLNNITLQTVCVRHEPPGVSGADLDEHTRAWVQALNESGKAYLTAAQVDGAWMARVSIGVLGTQWHHIEALWADMRSHAGQHAARLALAA
ncbi:pyridoxal phosphate-dependent decarboxylase family protein [Pinirhizobacter soli]|uniref:pyridoxal phosphate-dependent decarboxylase family protein n=1 Tax=Pinirhizobacter soli TaxID=2786953 RepID=UPI00202A7512|nr:pyridoxal-dependent decarboxylase [Pinirhizobacter soli]